MRTIIFCRFERLVPCSGTQNRYVTGRDGVLGSHSRVRFAAPGPGHSVPWNHVTLEGLSEFVINIIKCPECCGLPLFNQVPCFKLGECSNAGPNQPRSRCRRDSFCCQKSKRVFRMVAMILILYFQVLLMSLTSSNPAVAGTTMWCARWSLRSVPCKSHGCGEAVGEELSNLLWSSTGVWTFF